MADVFWMILFHGLFNVPLIVHVNILTLGLSVIVALSENLVTFIWVEQRTPGRSRLSSTLIASYAILLDGKITEYPLLEEVKVIVFSKLIGNWATEVSMVVGVVVAVGVSEVGLVVLEI